MKLGSKLRLGFSVPALMLLAAGTWSYYRFDALSRGVEAMLEEDDRSIEAANEMTLALERMDSAALLHVTGQRTRAIEVLVEADSSFLQSFRITRDNVTIDAESEALDSVEVFFARFRQHVDVLARQPTFDIYHSDVFPAFQNVKHEVAHFRRINQVEMEERAFRIGRQAYRASLPSAILAIAALIFMMLFAWLTRVYLIRPLQQILFNAEKWVETGRYSGGGIETDDEIERLDQALLRVAGRMGSSGKSR